MKSNVKFFVLGFVFCLMIGGVAIGMSEASEVYYSEFPIKVNGEIYTPEMPVLNYMGRTYLPLREFSTITGNIVDFVNGEIIVNSSCYTKEADIGFDKEIQKLKVEYKIIQDGEKLKAERIVWLDEKYICHEDVSVFNLYSPIDIVTYVVKDKLLENKQYLILELKDVCETSTDYKYYVISQEGDLLLSIEDETRGSIWMLANLEYEHEQGLNTMHPEIVNDGLRICVQSDYTKPYDVSSWKKIEYTIENGIIKAKQIEEFDPSVIECIGAT